MCTNNHLNAKQFFSSSILSLLFRSFIRYYCCTRLNILLTTTKKLDTIKNKSLFCFINIELRVKNGFQTVFSLFCSWQIVQAEASGKMSKIAFALGPFKCRFMFSRLRSRWHTNSQNWMQVSPLTQHLHHSDWILSARYALNNLEVWHNFMFWWPLGAIKRDLADNVLPSASQAKKRDKLDELAELKDQCALIAFKFIQARETTVLMNVLLIINKIRQGIFL